MPDEAPQISVVTATYHRPELVVEAVRSALSQEGVTLEVIVVEDDPVGPARTAIEALKDPRVRYLARPQASGGIPAHAYNDGLSLAKGTAVLFLDDDDLALPGAFAALWAALEPAPAPAPAPAFAFGLAEPFGGPPEVMVHEVAFFLDVAHRARAAKSRGSRELVSQLLFGSTPFVVSSCLFRRAALAAAGGLSTAIRIQPHLDVAARLARKHPWAFVDQNVVRYRVQEGSLMHDERNRPHLLQSYDQMYRNYRADFGLFDFARVKLYARTKLSLFG